MGDIARSEGKTPWDALCDIVVLDGLRTDLRLPRGGGNSTPTGRRGAESFSDQRVVVGASDAGAHLDMIDTFAYTTHLFKDAVRDHGLLGTEEAVHLLTQVPASLYGVRDRGVLQEGAWADFVLFDEDEIGSGPLHTRADLPGGSQRLFAESTGISSVIVNGEPIVEHGELVGTRPGRLLRSGVDTTSAPIS